MKYYPYFIITDGPATAVTQWPREHAQEPIGNQDP